MLSPCAGADLTACLLLPCTRRSVCAVRRNWGTVMSVEAGVCSDDPECQTLGLMPANRCSGWISAAVQPLAVANPTHARICQPRQEKWCHSRRGLGTVLSFDTMRQHVLLSDSWTIAVSIACPFCRSICCKGYSVSAGNVTSRREKLSDTREGVGRR